MVRTVPKKLLNFSRVQRQSQNPWEAKLWNHLRANRLGIKFKRQVPIGNFIVDFCCNKKKLVIEIDGGHHNEKVNRVKDLNKDAYLVREGYFVLRFWNNEVDKNIELVLEKINDALK